MTRLQNDINSIKRALWEASSVFLACIIVTSILYLEVVIIGGTCGEDSLVEAMQVLLLFVSSILFLQVAETTKHIAGGMYLISGFILCMALRELDAVTDLIPYVSWVHLVAIAVSGSAWLAYKNKDTVIRGLAVFARSRASVFMMTGLVCVLIFSRLFGSKHIWYTLYDVERVRILKNVVEEGLEFFGDALIFASSMMIFRKYRSPTQTASDTEDHSYKDDVGP